MSTRNLIATAVAALVLISGGRAADTEKPLYERLGGKPAIQAVAADLVDRILLDGRVNRWFAHAASSPENTALYKAKLSDFLCQSLGGPCKYSGLDMVTAHKGRGVTADAFNAVVEDLVATLDKFKVPQKEKADLLKVLGGLKPAIVTQ
jgi:hemoglobin